MPLVHVGVHNILKNILLVVRSKRKFNVSPFFYFSVSLLLSCDFSYCHFLLMKIKFWIQVTLNLPPSLNLPAWRLNLSLQNVLVVQRSLLYQTAIGMYLWLFSQITFLRCKFQFLKTIYNINRVLVLITLWINATVKKIIV